MSIPERYSRSVLVAGYDHEKIKKIKARVIGCGALGNYVVLGLAGFGMDLIALYDDDIIEESNLNRQLVFTNEDVGKNKAFSLQKRIEERIMPGTTIIEPSDSRVTKDNIDFLIPKNETDIVFLCVDTIDTRLLINDYCISKNIPFINGGTMGGREGEICTVIPGKTACLRCFMKPSGERVQCSRDKDPSIIGNSMLIASLMIVEFQHYMTGIPTTPPVLKYVGGRSVPKNFGIEENSGERILEPFYHLQINPDPACQCSRK